jgi:hypothetical protein
MGQVVASGEGVGMVWAEHSQLVGVKGFVCGAGASWITGLAPPSGQVVAGGEGVGVVWAEHSQLIGEEGFVCGSGAGWVTDLAPRVG